MRKILALFLVLLFIMLYAVPAFAYQTGISVDLDSTSANSGLIKIKASSEEGKRLKLKIENGEDKYTYDLRNDGFYESFSLQMGSGEYKVSVLENIEGSRYKYVFSEAVNARIEDERAIYLNSIQNVNWDDSMNAVKKAKELTEDISEADKKIEAIYSYLIDNFKYDFEKLDKLYYGYKPDINEFYENKKGICYDYASIFAAMLRSVGVPAKLVKGYAEGIKGYHAWNEVYIESREKWVTIDATYDSIVKEIGKKTVMIKKQSTYSKINEY